MDANVDLTRDLLHYRWLWISLAATWVYIGARGFRSRGAPAGGVLGPANAAWFTPVYFWGIESVLHAAWWLVAGFRGIAPHPFFFTQHGTFSMALGLATVAACLAAEACGRRAGLPARESGASIPLPVVAAVASVFANWWLKVSLVFYPLL